MSGGKANTEEGGLAANLAKLDSIHKTQRECIDKATASLDGQIAALDATPGNSPAKAQQRQKLVDARAVQVGAAAELDAAYVTEAARIVQLDARLAELDSIAGQMTAEADRLAKAAENAAAIAAILGFTKQAVGAINRI